MDYTFAVYIAVPRLVLNTQLILFRPKLIHPCRPRDSKVIAHVQGGWEDTSWMLKTQYLHGNLRLNNYIYRHWVWCEWYTYAHLLQLFHRFDLVDDVR